MSYAQTLSAAVRLEDKAARSKGLARRRDEAVLACDSDGPRYRHPSARQGPVLAHLAYLEIERARPVHDAASVLPEPRTRCCGEFGGAAMAARVRGGPNAGVDPHVRWRPEKRSVGQGGVGQG